MSLEKKPFVNYKDQEEKDKEKRKVFPVSLNDFEQQLLKKCKRLLEQPKDSTTIKDLMKIGAYVLHDQKTAYIIAALFKNKKNNKRTGLSEFE